MCGIAGFVKGSTFDNKNETQRILKNMSDNLFSRGPDSFGFWQDDSQKIGFAHRRLAILDLSESGHQPMKSESERFVLTYNGEIYNHLSLRNEILRRKPNHKWRGSSDTETLLACFEIWGVRDTLSLLIGMFAIAVWDKKNKELVLVRDRLGEKPLYYGWQNKGGQKAFIFASELKAISEHPQFEKNISRSALTLYMRFCYIPTPHSIYEGISKLEPGTFLALSLKDGKLTKGTYWDAFEAVANGIKDPLTGDDEEIVNKLEEVLTKSISNQMISDVPIGAFLSGGIDSSAVVSLMQYISNRPVQTFTIGFNEQNYNEAIFAKEVAAHLGTEHTELYLSSQDALNTIPLMPKNYSEPFSDSSQIPTFLVSSLARKNVTVSLSGDGGDELFCGYNRYTITDKYWNLISKFPISIRKRIVSSFDKVPSRLWNSSFKMLDTITFNRFNMLRLNDKIQKGYKIIDSKNVDDLYLRLVSIFNDPSSVVIDGEEANNFFSSSINIPMKINPIQKMMAIDSITYLPDDILTKVDRAAMAVSLETRVPFLDHNVFEFAWRIPQKMKLRNGVGKWALRKVLYKHVPKNLIERPKQGFGVPIGEWLQGPLLEWAENLLDEKRLESEGFFYPKVVRHMWHEHLQGLRNWQYQLWSILMFQAWLDENK